MRKVTLKFPMVNMEIINQFQKHASECAVTELDDGRYMAVLKHGVKAYSCDFSLVPKETKLELVIPLANTDLLVVLRYLAHDLKLLPNMKKAWIEGTLEHQSDLGVILALRDLFKES